jgi:hypothetical protein
MDSELWNRIVHFRVGSGNDSFDFISRLARDNRWSADFARRVYREYLHFMYLAVRANHPVTPSDEVDQAWHLHLTYSRSYWDEFCGAVLEEVVHHDPTRGGIDERHKFRSWYAETLQSYEATFGYPPPPDIWPRLVTRFERAPDFVRINTQDFVLVPRSIVLGGGFISIAAGAVGCGVNPFIFEAKTFLVGYLLAYCISILIMVMGSRIGGAGGRRIAWIPLGFVIIIGLIRILFGLMIGEPVKYLVFIELCGVLVLFSLFEKKYTGRGGDSGCGGTFGYGGSHTDGGSVSDGDDGGDSGCGGCGGCGGGGD